MQLMLAAREAPTHFHSLQPESSCSSVSDISSFDFTFFWQLWGLLGAGGRLIDNFELIGWEVLSC